MYRPKSGGLSVLERAQGQLAGKRFGNKTAPAAYQREESDDEQGELKAYLTQLQHRTSQQALNDDDSDESYRPVAHSTPLKSGSQFLKSSRMTTETSQQQKSNATKTADKPLGTRKAQDVNSPDVSEDIDLSGPSEQDFDDQKLGRNRGGLEGQNLYKSQPKFRGDLFSSSPIRHGGGGSGVPKMMKSAAFERIMSNLVSDESDVEDLIKDADSPRRMISPDKPVSAPSPDVEVDTSQSIASFDDEEEPLSEVGAESGTAAFEGPVKLFHAEDLKPDKPIATESDVENNVSTKPDQDARIKETKVKKGPQLFTKTDIKINKDSKGTKSPQPDVVVEDIPSNTETEIKTATESLVKLSEKSSNNSPSRSDDETEVDASSYSSIASNHSGNSARTRRSSDSENSSKRTVSESYASQSLSEGKLSERHRSDITTKSSKTSRHSSSQSTISKSNISDTSRDSRSGHHSYTDDFSSDTNLDSMSARSSGTLTQSSAATVKHSPAPPRTPTPRKSRPRRVRVANAGVQTADQVPGQGHWVFDRTSSGQPVDVAEMLKDYKASSIPAGTLRAVSSVDYSTMLLQQTLKLQFEQTQQSIQRMLQVHQSLLESVQSDYKYTTLEDTKAYIQQQREKRNQRETMLEDT